MTTVKRLVLTNYRNHESLTLDFGDRLNLIVGGNARGKTNILESIYFLSRGKSFRSSDYRELIHWEAKRCQIDADVERRGGKSKARVQLGDGEKVFHVDGKRKRTMGEGGAVLFVPQDITIFRRSPGDRRHYLNEWLSGLVPEYRKRQKDYEKVVTQRNKILREGAERGWTAVTDELEVWSERLVTTGCELIRQRRQWIEDMAERLPDLYHYMGGVGNTATIRYQPNVEENRELFWSRLEEREDLERIRLITLVGPHRDDWTAVVDDHDLKAYGSQAQMRMMAISLKMVELQMAREWNREAPILLLDDVISELDEQSTKRLLDYVSDMDGQVFITSTHHDILVDGVKQRAEVFSVSS